jgi:hypothetical protein
MWRKVFASKSYRSGHNEAVIASGSYCSGNIQYSRYRFYNTLNKQYALVNGNK